LADPAPAVAGDAADQLAGVLRHEAQPLAVAEPGPFGVEAVEPVLQRIDLAGTEVMARADFGHGRQDMPAGPVALRAASPPLLRKASTSIATSLTPLSPFNDWKWSFRCRDRPLAGRRSSDYPE